MTDQLAGSTTQQNVSRLDLFVPYQDFAVQCRDTSTRVSHKNDVSDDVAPHPQHDGREAEEQREDGQDSEDSPAEN
jgi:hypothetical protein